VYVDGGRKAARTGRLPALGGWRAGPAGPGPTRCSRRAQALEKGDAEDAGELRADLAALGYVVRDGRKRQFWRVY
jgi:hypothetical protein